MLEVAWYIKCFLQLVNRSIVVGIRTRARLVDGVHPQCRIAAHPYLERAVQSRSDRGGVTGVFARVPELRRETSREAARQRADAQRVSSVDMRPPSSVIYNRSCPQKLGPTVVSCGSHVGGSI